MKKCLAKFLAAVLVLTLCVGFIIPIAAQENGIYEGWNYRFTNFVASYDFDFDSIWGSVTFTDAPTTITTLRDIIVGEEDGQFVGITGAFYLWVYHIPESMDIWEYLYLLDSDPGNFRDHGYGRGEQLFLTDDFTIVDFYGYDSYAVPTGSSIVLQEGIYVFGLTDFSKFLSFVVVGGDASPPPPDSTPANAPEPTPPPQAPNMNTASSWAREYIAKAYIVGIIPSGLQNNYRNNITRAEFTSIAVLIYETITGEEITGRVTFDDTDNINVQKAAYIGIVTGTGDNNFSPNMQFNREQAAVIISRLAEAIGQPLPLSTATFADNVEISSWARQQSGQVQAAGIMEGIGGNRFNPRGNFTREASIITMLRLFNALV